MSILDCIARPSQSDGDPSIVQKVLQSVRQHLGMEVAYVSEFVGNDSVFRTVDAPGLEAMIKPGDSRPLDDVYCLHILAGRLPELIPDTSEIEFTASMPITQAVPIGAHVSVPLRLSNGEVYGMFCCLSPHSNKSLNQRDLQVMRSFADIAAEQIEKEQSANRELAAKRERIADAIANKRFSIALQPIWEFQEDRLVGFECLSRFNAAPLRTPDLWFAEAAEVGLGVELEIAAIEAALVAGSKLPDDVYITINASADAIVHDAFAPTLETFPLARLVLEITEHAAVANYAVLSDRLGRLRQQGVRLAIDDAGAGHSGLKQIVSLRPDIIKLDMALTRNVDTDPARRALASALIYYAQETGCQILAEGIETTSELETLKMLGIMKGQGYLLGRPVPFTAALELAGSPRKMAETQAA
jgi:EAL domain-containing protein (putative c-di-GMP-specific phosphodiesterase class I)